MITPKITDVSLQCFNIIRVSTEYSNDAGEVVFTGVTVPPLNLSAQDMATFVQSDIAANVARITDEATQLVNNTALADQLKAILGV